MKERKTKEFQGFEATLELCEFGRAVSSLTTVNIFSSLEKTFFEPPPPILNPENGSGRLGGSTVKRTGRLGVYFEKQGKKNTYPLVTPSLQGSTKQICASLISYDSSQAEPSKKLPAYGSQTVMFYFTYD